MQARVFKLSSLTCMCLQAFQFGLFTNYSGCMQPIPQYVLHVLHEIYVYVGLAQARPNYFQIKF